MGIAKQQAGGSGGGVQSVTGYAAGVVDNTDPDNPVVTALIPSENLTDLADLFTALVNIQFEGGSALGDASKTMTANERLVYTDQALSANRQIELPIATSVNAMREVIIVDNFGALSLTTPRIITVIPNAADTIDGTTTYIMRVPYGSVKFMCDGVSRWTIDQNYAQRYDAALVGTPTAPTATLGTNTTQIASTAYVLAAIVANQTDTLTVTQSSHGFVVGDIIYCTGGSTFAKAQANAVGTAVPGFMVTVVTNVNLFSAVIPFNYVTGLSGLTAGGQYFLSAATAGVMTLTEPAQPNISAPVFVALTTTTGIFFPQRPRVKSATDGVATDFVIPALDADLQTIAGLTATTDNFIQSKSSAWASRTVAQVKTDLGVLGLQWTTISSGGSTTAGTTRFIALSGGGVQTTAANSNMQPAVAVTISNPKFKTTTAQPASGTLVITSLKNGSPGNISITIAAGAAAGYFTDAVNVDAVAATDEYCFQIVNNAAGGSATLLYFSFKMT